MMPSIHFRHICFTGPKKEPAHIEFKQGLNLLHGASDTGKSFVLEAIVYMLGGKSLRDIPERVGYDSVFLGIETNTGESFTLRRSTNGGNYHLYMGLHTSSPNGIEPKIIYRMGVKNIPDKAQKISEFILSKINLSGKKLQKNQRFDTVNLNLSNLFNLCIIDEEMIYRQSSVIDRNDTILNTQDHSLFALLLTGVDASSLVPSIPTKDKQLSKNAKIEVIDTLIEKGNQCIHEAEISYEDAKEQLSRIQITLEREEKILATSDAKYRELIKERTFLRNEQSLKVDRRQEIDGVVQRFQLLYRHYLSDLERLDSISEVGVFMHMLPGSLCPHCGALPETQDHSKNCSANIAPTIDAAIAEKNKILRLKFELEQTIKDLQAEALYVEHVIPGITDKLKSLEHEIQEISPHFKKNTATFSEILEKRTFLKEIISSYEQISSLMEMKKELEAEAKMKGAIGRATERSLPKSLLDDLAKHIETILKAWEFPDSDRVFFNTETNDLTISGKCRKDRGKGMRSVIHAAFSIGLLEFCLKHSLPHLGVVILDSPLLAYREPDDDKDSLQGTKVQDNFYKYLLSIKDRQVIIIENVDPPSFMLNKPYSVHFSKNVSHGRYGFFPPVSTGEGV